MLLGFETKNPVATGFRPRSPISKYAVRRFKYDLAVRTKEQILLEIKRTAQANDGTPLGQGRFERETGVKKSEWYGRFWTKWSEAVAEAGLEPNRFDNAHDSEVVLAYVASETRRLGRIPTEGDLKMSRRADPTVPSAWAIQKRWRKQELIREVAEFCEREGDYEDVLELLIPRLEPDHQSDPAATEDQSRDGFVYLLKSGKHFKIGRTNSLSRREREIGLQLPVAADRIHVISTDDAAGIENYWHRRFSEKRVNGEWFELSSEDVRAFKRRKFM